MTAAPRLHLSLVASTSGPSLDQIRSKTMQKSFDKVFDPYRYKIEFPDLWSAYLRDHFRNPEAVAAGFDVTFQTACNWWNATHRPSGDKVALAAISDPVGFRSSMMITGRAA
jgi:hypothetical protein